MGGERSDEPLQRLFGHGVGIDADDVGGGDGGQRLANEQVPDGRRHALLTGRRLSSRHVGLEDPEVVLPGEVLEPVVELT